MYESRAEFETKEKKDFIKVKQNGCDVYIRPLNISSVEIHDNWACVYLNGLVSSLITDGISQDIIDCLEGK